MVPRTLKSPQGMMPAGKSPGCSGKLEWEAAGEMPTAFPCISVTPVLLLVFFT